MFENNRGGFLSSIPPVTRNLIIICLIIWVVEAIVPRFGNTIVRVLGLHYVAASGFNPIQIVTYLFVHDPSSPFHVLFNMFTLWMFGTTLERVWGSKRFFVFYFICGIGAALVQEAVWALTWLNEMADNLTNPNGLTHRNLMSLVSSEIASGNPHYIALAEQFKNMLVTVGASGAIFGLLLGFAFVFPNQPMYLFFIPIPIKAKYMVLGYGVIEFFLGIGGGGTVAHFAHLGGLLFALPILLYWKHKGELRGGGFY